MAELPASRLLTAMCAIALLLGGALAASTPARAGVVVPGATAAPARAREPARGCLPAHTGYLRARLRGASTLNIDWRGGELQCEGDPRPGERGIRLTFVGTAGPAHHRVRFVFGIDAAARVGVAREVPANVTLIFEGEGRVYSTRGEGQCTIDRLREQPLRGAVGARLLQVSARGFCVGPASALEDEAAGSNDQVLLSRFDFEGELRVPGVAGATP